MDRSGIRDLLLAAGVGLLLGVSGACAYLTVAQLRERFARELIEFLWTVILIAAVAAVVAFFLFARARGASLRGPATGVSSIRAYARAVASRPPARRLAR